MELEVTEEVTVSEPREMLNLKSDSLLFRLPKDSLPNLKSELERVRDQRSDYTADRKMDEEIYKDSKRLIPSMDEPWEVGAIKDADAVVSIRNYLFKKMGFDPISKQKRIDEAIDVKPKHKSKKKGKPGKERRKK